MNRVSGEDGDRTIVLRFPDWPVYVVAMDRKWDLLAPAAVAENRRVFAVNQAARRCGVKPGMKVRHALGVVPSLNIGDSDPGAEAAAHEEVLAHLEEVTASVETLRPGLLAMPERSLRRYYGSEAKAVELVMDAVARAGADCVPGVADDLVTAVWAAREGRTVPPGGSASYLAHLPLSVLTVEPALGAPVEMAETLVELGIRTLGDFAALPRRDVVGRFGAAAGVWHRIASGEPERTLSPVQVNGPLQIHVEPEDPVTSTEATAFLARRAAVRLHADLVREGVACLRLLVCATILPPPGYTGPLVVERLWRCREPLNEGDTAQRIRWQLDGWITRARGIANSGDVGFGEGSEGVDGTAGIRSVTLTPVECVPAGEVMGTLWGGPDDGVRAARVAAAQVQALLGTGAVQRPVLRGGHLVADRVVMVPYGEADPAEIQALPTRTWDGELPAPLPGLLGWDSGGVRLCDGHGHNVGVTGRGVLSADPAILVQEGRNYAITGWAGPWPVDEQWWDNRTACRYARLQIATEEPAAYLLICREGRWWIDGSY